MVERLPPATKVKEVNTLHNDRYRDLKWHKRVHDFPFTHAIALAMVFSAIVLMLTDGISPLGFNAVLLMVSFALPGAILIILGLQWRRSVITGYGIEVTGHWLAVGAWIIDIWLLVTIGALANIVSPMFFIAAHALRAYRLYVDSRQIRAIVREAVRQHGGETE